LYFQSTIPITWRHWTDDLAGLDHYEYEVYNLQYDGSSLKEGSKVTSSNQIQQSVSMVRNEHDHIYLLE